MKIGIIGAENSHTAAIARVINVQKKMKGFSVDYVWGETKDFAEKAAEAGKIPNIVKKQTDMLGKIDALIVDHRHGKYHLAAALPFIKAKIPTFVDKPFCYRSTQGKRFLALARKKRVPVTSFSTLPRQKAFLDYKKALAGMGKVYGGATCGPADLKSPWGGVFFYGIHQVDLALNTFGYDVERALITKTPNGATGQLIYSSGRIVTMNFIKEGRPKFHITAYCEKGNLARTIYNDKSPYLGGIKVFTRMFRTWKEPYSRKHILKPVQVLEALERSVKSGKAHKIAK